MKSNDTDNPNKINIDDLDDRRKKQRRAADRRCDTVTEDIVDRRRMDRRVTVEEIDFEDRRKQQRRAKVLGLDYQDQRTGDRRKTNRRKDERKNEQ